MKDEARQLEIIAGLLRAESTVALATVDEHGEPCVASLFYLVDGDMNLYWLSSAASMHSRNLGIDSTASAAIHRHTEHWKEICGVQMRGRVEVVSEAERRSTLLKVYCERFSLGSVLRMSIGRSTMYQFRPEWFRYIDNSKRFGYKFEVMR
jgi:uncharacterized protein